MGVGESIFEQLLAQREAQRQYSFEFMPPVRNTGPYAASLDSGDTTLHVVASDFGRHGLMFESIRLTGCHAQDYGSARDASQPHAQDYDSSWDASQPHAQDYGSARDASQPGDLMRVVEKIVVDVECPYGPIKCIENDERLTSALLRTDPTADGCYFEIVVDGGTLAEMRHYKILGPARERRQMPVNLGRRVFVKMIDGLADAFCAAEPVI